MSNQCFKNKDFESRYFALKETEDQVLQLELTSAVAPFTQTLNAITRFNDPVTDDNGLKNSTVILDDSGNISDANSMAITPNASNPNPGGETLWINSSDGNKLYRGSVNVEDTGATDVTGPVSSTDNAIARFDGVTGKVIQNSNVIVDDLDNLITSGTVQTDAVISFPGTGATGVNIDNVNINNQDITNVVNLNSKVVNNLVEGPTSAFNERLAVFDGTTGKLLKNSNLLILGADPADGLIIPGELRVDEINEQTPTNGIDLNGKNTNDLVTGPASSFTSRLAAYSDTTGKAIKNTNILLTGSEPMENMIIPGNLEVQGTLTAPIINNAAGFITIEGVVISGSAISSVTSINGDIPLNISGSDNQIVRMNGTVGIQNTTITIDDNDNMIGNYSVQFSLLGSNPIPATLGVVWTDTSGDLSVADDYAVITPKTVKTVNSLLTWTADNIADEGPLFTDTSVAATFVGDSAGSFPSTIDLQLLGDIVTINVRTVNADLNGNASLTDLAIIPIAYRPSSLRIGTYQSIETGTLTNIGSVSILANGDCIIYKDNGAGTWAAGAGSGFQNITFSYRL